MAKTKKKDDTVWTTLDVGDAVDLESATMDDVVSASNQMLNEYVDAQEQFDGTLDLGNHLDQCIKTPKSSRFETDVQYVKMYKLNLDEVCKNDFLNGKGLRLRSADSFDKKGEKIYDGLQSTFFGSDYGDENAFAERYSCACKNLIGKQYLGQYCEICNTEVQYEENDLGKTGWVILDHYTVISPIYYQKLENALGNFDGNEKVIARILKVSANRNPEDVYDEKDLANLQKHPFSRKGMTWACEHMLEILEFYRDKRAPKSKAALFEELINDVDKITTHSMPIYTAVMRTETAGKKNEKMFKIRINTRFSSIINSANFVNRYTDPTKVTEEESCLIDMQLMSIQNDLNEVFEEEYNTISGKKGEILGKVTAGRYNLSSRNIIIAGSGRLRANEIEMCYSTALELFRYELIAEYSKLFGITIAKAQNRWHRAKSHFDMDFYNIMLSMISDPENIPYICIVINRNPSINFGAFIRVVVAKIKPDINDKTMTVNTRVIGTLNADFDGDQMNIFRIVGSYLSPKFVENMDPVRNLFVNRIDGHVNKSMLNIKDEVVVYQELMTCY